MKHKYAEYIIAWAEGKSVQRKTDGEWLNLNPGHAYFNNDNEEYRIKPEPIVLYVNEYQDGLGGVCTSFEEAASIKAEKRVFIRTIKLMEVEDDS